ncbi:PREDICTED: regulator of microtubule dynamics protein 1-like [Ceratosolen solmsi marchali]|uniref:Regulator of microtubule dynamics protein 1 n=1 Tax=Ceratosolen solmsi marchali TaxID=326594 RepID=A0AAJ7DYG9_9HYME|nr:PREDICTED: regulator of microtubule dynamics protein 1-like [Ceratosolen solmsi marchali]
MSTLQNSNLIAAVIGATIGVISVAMFIYNRVMENQQHSNMSNNIDNVNRKVLALQAELDELRNQQAHLQKNKQKKIQRKACSNDNSHSGTDNVDIDTYSITGTDAGDDEFFDCSDDEEDIDNGTTEESIEDDPTFLELFTECEKDLLHLNSYNKLKILLNKNPYNVEIVWRFARSCYYCSLKDNNRIEDYICEGCDVCEKVLDVEHGKLYEWYAILIGVKSRFLPVKEKIISGFRFKMYLEKALEMNPNNGYLYYLMGRFKYEISELNWFEKKAAAMFVSELPSGSYNDAILDFEKAETLSKEPNYVNKLYLGKSYIAIGKVQKGVAYLSLVKDMEITNIEEEKVLSEAEILLKKYSNYYTEL